MPCINSIRASSTLRAPEGAGWGFFSSPHPLSGSFSLQRLVQLVVLQEGIWPTSLVTVLTTIWFSKKEKFSPNPILAWGPSCSSFPTFFLPAKCGLHAPEPDVDICCWKYKMERHWNKINNEDNFRFNVRSLPLACNRLLNSVRYWPFIDHFLKSWSAWPQTQGWRVKNSAICCFCSWVKSCPHVCPPPVLPPALPPACPHVLGLGLGPKLASELAPALAPGLALGLTSGLVPWLLQTPAVASLITVSVASWKSGWENWWSLRPCLPHIP